MVCAGSPQELAAIARMGPNIILAENPQLIGVGKREAEDLLAVRTINETVWKINSEIRVLHGAGISSGRDVYNIVSLGAQGSGSTSGIIRARDPSAMVEEMIRSVREAWDQRHQDYS